MFGEDYTVGQPQVALTLPGGIKQEFGLRSLTSLKVLDVNGHAELPIDDSLADTTLTRFQRVEESPVEVRDAFAAAGIDLKIIKPKPFYRQINFVSRVLHGVWLTLD